MFKIHPIKIASAHIHMIPKNNPAMFHKYPMDSLGVADKRPLYIYHMKEMVWWEIYPKMKKLPKPK